MAGLSVRAEAAWNTTLKNQSPIGIRLSVSHANGAPVTGLTDANVAVWDIGGMAGDEYAVKHDVESFQPVQPGIAGGPAAPDGVYAFGISSQPIGPVWPNAFMFPLVVEVTDGADRGRTMLTIRW